MRVRPCARAVHEHWLTFVHAPPFPPNKFYQVQKCYPWCQLSQQLRGKVSHNTAPLCGAGCAHLNVKAIDQTNKPTLLIVYCTNHAMLFVSVSSFFQIDIVFFICSVICIAASYGRPVRDTFWAMELSPKYRKGGKGPPSGRGVSAKPGGEAVYWPSRIEA